MAIKFDDRIETNVAGDVLITGEQISISSKNDSIKIGSDFEFSLSIVDNTYAYDTQATSIRVLNDLPDAINKINNDLIGVTSEVIKPAIDLLSTSIIDLAEFFNEQIITFDNKVDTLNNQVNTILSNGVITINTNKKFFGDTLITGTSQLNDYLKNLDSNITLPLITLLSAPISLSTKDTEGGLYYSTKSDAYYGTDLTIIPKDTLICVMSTNNISERNFGTYDDAHFMGVLDKNIQILSMPVSADSIHNNFETRIANIESLLALKQ